MSQLKIFALIAFRDEEQDLPGYFSHLRDYVDGFVAFDDCSTDRSQKIARAEPKMVRLLERHTASLDHHFEVENRKALLQAAHDCGADWVLCCDADERYETRFLMQLHSFVENPPVQIMGLRLASVWENVFQYRVGNGRKLVLFPSVPPDPYYPHGLLHQEWYPPKLAGLQKGILDFRLYHLGSMTREHRQARYEKFIRIDPNRRHQPQGYEHLLIESNIQVSPIYPDRAFRCA